MTEWAAIACGTYATLHRDNSDVPLARFHVIAEAHEAARAMNALAVARVLNGAMRVGGGET